MPHKLTDLLDQIDRLDQQATKGPWDATTSEATMNDRSLWRIGQTSKPQVSKSVMRTADAEFIALARTALPALAEAVYHVLDLLDVVEKADKYAYEFGGNKSPSLVTTNEVRKAITDALGDDDA